MIREAESGVLRAVQKWAAKQIALIPEFMAEGVFVMAEDEGDYESELEKQTNRHKISAFVHTPALRKIDHYHRQAVLNVKVYECVQLHRSHGRIVNWTALRVAERILATFDDSQMTEAPWAAFYADGESIAMESQSPWLIYNVNLVGKMILSRRPI